jgi:predicted TIM-barrel fold metal-dependent hydrolase
MQIVDAHHHLWDLRANHYPWLLDPKTPRVYGDHSPICKDYTLSDYLADMREQPMVKSVHVQADHDFSDPVRETEWLQSVADDPGNPGGYPHAIVAWADLSAPNAADVLEGHCRFANMRGIRQALNGIVTNPARHPNLLADPAWIENLGLLEEHSLSFDLQLFAVQMPDAAAIIARYPRVQFILCHLGLPMDQTPAGLEAWRGGMRLLASLPNVAVKISGFGMFDRKWTVDGIRPLLLETIDMFGAERVMFGSNFPVDGMMATFGRVWSAFLDLTAAFSAAERQMMFHDNAMRFYRITP